MIDWKLKLWRGAGAAAALGLAACGGEAGGEAGNSSASASHGEAGEAAGPAPASTASPAGGEHGEAGVADAYAGVSGAQRTALRLQHLKGFVLVAERVSAAGAAEEASALVQQGLLEVYDPAADQFGALDAAPVRAAADAANARSLQAAERALDAARPQEADAAALAVAMTDIAAGLYQQVNLDGAINPIEYQHSLGAALAARDALVAGRPSLRARNSRAYDEAMREIDRLLALWPTPTAPENPAAYRDVLARASGVRLALSPFL